MNDQHVVHSDLLICSLFWPLYLIGCMLKRKKKREARKAKREQAAREEEWATLTEGNWLLLFQLSEAV